MAVADTDGRSSPVEDRSSHTLEQTGPDDIVSHRTSIARSTLVKRLLPFALSAFAAALAAFAVAGPAAASTPCWKTLINDWYDGRIDRVYPVACYRQALEHMPEDIAQYSSLRDDINRALAAAIAAGGNGGGTSSGGDGGSNTSGGSTGSGTSNSSSTSAGGTFYGGPTSSKTTTAASAGRKDGGSPVRSALDSIGPDSADSVPIPLIVLGALAIVLLALGSAGFVARRMQTRKAAPGPGTKA
jgi:hypothetical protein